MHIYILRMIFYLVGKIQDNGNQVPNK